MEKGGAGERGPLRPKSLLASLSLGPKSLATRLRGQSRITHSPSAPWESRPLGGPEAVLCMETRTTVEPAAPAPTGVPKPCLIDEGASGPHPDTPTPGTNPHLKQAEGTVAQILLSAGQSWQESLKERKPSQGTRRGEGSRLAQQGETSKFSRQADGTSKII